MAGLQSGDGRMMIDSVVWTQYFNMTDTQTDSKPRRHSKCCANALHRVAKTKALQSQALHSRLAVTLTIGVLKLKAIPGVA